MLAACVGLPLTLATGDFEGAADVGKAATAAGSDTVVDEGTLANCAEGEPAAGSAGVLTTADD